MKPQPHAPRWLLAATLIFLLGAACSAGVASTSTTVPVAATEACPVTVPPQPGWVPPPDWMPDPRGDYNAVWYGDADLWTMLDSDGEVWTAWDTGRLPLKHFWFSTDFDWREEPEPAVDLVLRRLDAPEVIDIPGPASHGIRPRGELHEFMITGGSLTPGCWEITATYRGTALSFVALLEPFAAP